MNDWNRSYWEGRWERGETGWDMGQVSPPLQHFIDGLKDRDQRILIPGCGNAYEGEYLHQQGFRNVFLLDVSEQALAAFHDRFPDFPEEHLVRADFFEHTKTYDLILEQTFFCAIDPALRPKYVRQAAGLLVPGGLLVGLLWSVPMHEDRPPFGGSIEEYRSLFEPYFEVEVLEEATNSIAPRLGREVFVQFRKK
ncbi:MAG: methyltransferase domain-containing protein [Leptolyngbya sp. SIO3F4]|nr:methyltransferase domain-containing protein [Leptolyngbya sp. SIO3F4]